MINKHNKINELINLDLQTSIRCRLCFEEGDDLFVKGDTIYLIHKDIIEKRNEILIYSIKSGEFSTIYSSDSDIQFLDLEDHKAYFIKRNRNNKNLLELDLSTGKIREENRFNEFLEGIVKVSIRDKIFISNEMIYFYNKGVMDLPPKENIKEIYILSIRKLIVLKYDHQILFLDFEGRIRNKYESTNRILKFVMNGSNQNFFTIETNEQEVIFQVLKLEYFPEELYTANNISQAVIDDTNEFLFSIDYNGNVYIFDIKKRLDLGHFETAGKLNFIYKSPDNKIYLGSTWNILIEIDPIQIRSSKRIPARYLKIKGDNSESLSLSAMVCDEDNLFFGTSQGEIIKCNKDLYIVEQHQIHDSIISEIFYLKDKNQFLSLGYDNKVFLTNSNFRKIDSIACGSKILNAEVDVKNNCILVNCLESESISINIKKNKLFILNKFFSNSSSRFNFNKEIILVSNNGELLEYDYSKNIILNQNLKGKIICAKNNELVVHYIDKIYLFKLELRPKEKTIVPICTSGSTVLIPSTKRIIRQTLNQFNKIEIRNINLKDGDFKTLVYDQNEINEQQIPNALTSPYRYFKSNKYFPKDDQISESLNYKYLSYNEYSRLLYSHDKKWVYNASNLIEVRSTFKDSITLSYITKTGKLKSFYPIRNGFFFNIGNNSFLLKILKDEHAHSIIQIANHVGFYEVIDISYATKNNYYTLHTKGKDTFIRRINIDNHDNSQADIKITNYNNGEYLINNLAVSNDDRNLILGNVHKIHLLNIKNSQFLDSLDFEEEIIDYIFINNKEFIILTNQGLTLVTIIRNHLKRIKNKKFEEIITNINTYYLKNIEGHITLNNDKRTYFINNKLNINGCITFFEDGYFLSNSRNILTQNKYINNSRYQYPLGLTYELENNLFSIILKQKNEDIQRIIDNLNQLLNWYLSLNKEIRHIFNISIVLFILIIVLTYLYIFKPHYLVSILIKVDREDLKSIQKLVYFFPIILLNRISYSKRCLNHFIKELSNSSDNVKIEKEKLTNFKCENIWNDQVIKDYVESKHIWISGIGGIGKTTLAFYILEKKCKNTSKILPLIIDYDWDTSIESYIQSYFNYNGYKLPARLIQTLIQNGNIALLIDGFSERSTDLDFNQLFCSNYQTLIITTRNKLPHEFKNHVFEIQIKNHSKKQFDSLIKYYSLKNKIPSQDILQTLNQIFNSDILKPFYIGIVSDALSKCKSEISNIENILEVITQDASEKSNVDLSVLLRILKFLGYYSIKDKNTPKHMSYLSVIGILSREMEERSFIDNDHNELSVIQVISRIISSSIISRKISLYNDVLYFTEDGVAELFASLYIFEKETIKNISNKNFIKIVSNNQGVSDFILLFRSK